MAVDMKKLHPKLRKLTNELVTACERKGIPIKITQGFRSKAEQDALYEQGRTKPGNKVTNARGSTYSSMHMWGVAIDFCRADGKGAYDDSDGFFSKVGKVGKSLGLIWGGDWTSPKDKPHFQLSDWGSTPTKLKARYGTPDKFMKTWGDGTASKTKTKTTTSTKRAEDVSMTTIKKGSKGKAVEVWQVIIGARVDGTFGDNTVTKTKAFQKKHKLDDDGIVGNATWKAGLESI